MSPDPAEQLRHSWEANAPAWSAAVRERRIESRRAGTDAAIVRAVRELAPRRVLDVGCGEGWLARALAEEGIAVTGTDASAALVEAARAGGGGTFHALSYEEMASAPESLGERDFDAVVCNFSLLGEDLSPLLISLRTLTSPDGVLLVQTVHPWIACGGKPYRDGWRTETFDAFGGAFPEPMPWYFRTLASWVDLLDAAGWRVRQAREPVHPETGRPLSLLLRCEWAACAAGLGGTGP